MADLTTKYAGVTFKNPIVAVAGPLGRTFESLKRSIEAGCGAVTLKSNNIEIKKEITPRPSAHVYPRPAHTFLKKYGLTNMMINWEGVPVDFTAEEERKMIERIKPIAKDHGCKIIANMHPGPEYLENLDVFKRDMETILSAEPDLIEFCSCPYHFPPESFFPEAIDYNMAGVMTQKVYSVVLETVNVPVIAKSSGPIFLNAYNIFKEVGLDNFHLTDGPSFYGTVVDINNMAPIAPGPAVITYGAHRRPIVNLHCARVRDLGDNFDLMSSSGVWTANDVIERMMCGVQLVGLHTAIQFHGHKQFAKIIDGISEWLDKKGMSLQEVVGKAVPKIVSQDAHDDFLRECDRSVDQIKPVVDMNLCTGCGICANCIHGGIAMDEKKPELNLNNCVRCGICESVCPVDAITLETK